MASGFIKQHSNAIICGNVLTELRKFPDERIDCIITSPPYYGLRDYGDETKTIWGGDKNCQHEWKTDEFKQHSGRGDAQKRLRQAIFEI